MVENAKLLATKKISKRIAIVSVIIFLLLLLFSVKQLYAIQSEIDHLKNERNVLKDEADRYKDELDKLKPAVNDLKATQEGILDFLSKVTSGEDVKLLGVGQSQWEKTKDELVSLKPGQRKQAVFGAILLAWKQVPFKMGGKRLGEGVDSTTFVMLVLSKVGITIPKEPKRRPSDIMMQLFQHVETPEPGDLMFYEGEGHYAVFYLGRGQDNGQGICLGTVGKDWPLQILDSKEFAPDHFLGYYRVTYSS